MYIRREDSPSLAGTVGQVPNWDLSELSTSVINTFLIVGISIFVGTFTLMAIFRLFTNWGHWRLRNAEPQQHYVRTLHGWVRHDILAKRRARRKEAWNAVARMFAWKTTLADYTWVFWDPTGMKQMDNKEQRERTFIRHLPHWMRSLDHGSLSPTYPVWAEGHNSYGNSREAAFPGRPSHGFHIYNAKFRADMNSRYVMTGALPTLNNIKNTSTVRKRQVGRRSIEFWHAKSPETSRATRTQLPLPWKPQDHVEMDHIEIIEGVGDITPSRRGGSSLPSSVSTAGVGTIESCALSEAASVDVPPLPMRRNMKNYKTRLRNAVRDSVSRMSHISSRSTIIEGEGVESPEASPLQSPTFMEGSEVIESSGAFAPGASPPQSPISIGGSEVIEGVGAFTPRTFPPQSPATMEGLEAIGRVGADTSEVSDPHSPMATEVLQIVEGLGSVTSEAASRQSPASTSQVEILERVELSEDVSVSINSLPTLQLKKRRYNIPRRSLFPIPQLLLPSHEPARLGIPEIRDPGDYEVVEENLWIPNTSNHDFEELLIPTTSIRFSYYTSIDSIQHPFPNSLDHRLSNLSDRGCRNSGTADPQSRVWTDSQAPSIRLHNELSDYEAEASLDWNISLRSSSAQSGSTVANAIQDIEASSPDQPRIPTSDRGSGAIAQLSFSDLDLLNRRSISSSSSSTRIILQKRRNPRRIDRGILLETLLCEDPKSLKNE
ncbi:hypothetical protein MMC12_000138 [Toensbergia leucococca]|nr:hypothetical protein [Toensbergia leucococca]